jgi:hypothetical protein
MAKKSDVELTVTGLDGTTPIGVTISSSVGAIPTALVDLAPAPPGKIKIDGAASGVLANIDYEKRKQDITVNIKVKTYVSEQGKKDHEFKFVGVLDGLSVSNAVGNNSYQAVLKNKAQTLLEVTTLTPGLYPTSVNIYKSPLYATVNDANAEDSRATVAWGNLKAVHKDVFEHQPIKSYTELMKRVIDLQKGEYNSFVGTEKLISGSKPMKVFEDGRYKIALSKAAELLNTIDLSAVEGGSLNDIKASHPRVSNAIKSHFTSGPNILLENYMNFLAYMGCTLLFSNKKIYVVPINSYIKGNYAKPGEKQLQTKPNCAHPADYNSYVYNDNGYRDILSVLIAHVGHIGETTHVTTAGTERGLIGEYVDEHNLTQASGVLVVNAHEFLVGSPDAARPKDSRDGKNRLDQEGDGMCQDKQPFGAASSQAKSDVKKVEEDKKQSEKSFAKDLLDNYAEIKLYQARYNDRSGSLVMDFNPKWVPGTSGWLYIRQTDMFIAFYVNNVTHRVDMSAPNNGSAITTVNFNCGRLGRAPVGVSEDKFIGYNLGKETSIQDKYIGDNK